MQATRFDTAHEDLIHDVAYNYYGKRLVTCSSDQRLKVWDFNESGNGVAQWELNDSWKAHDCSILKVIWANPEFGQVIASCSFDRQVKIWEEQEIEPKNSQKRWAEKFRLVESRGSVQDIEFAPGNGSLRLATCAADGIVRIYEALEPTNLTQWPQMEEFEISSGASDAGGSYCLSWCPNRCPAPMMVVGLGKENGARIFKHDGQNRWYPGEYLPGHEKEVHDVCWAPSMGRSYQLIATACKDQFVRIFKLTEISATQSNPPQTPQTRNSSQSKLNSSPSASPNQSQGGKRFKVEVLAAFDDHQAEVWRVEWNIEGTILASSGDDGTVRLWKAGFDGVWRQMSVISADGSNVGGGGHPSQ
ncbi:WD40-repeat-containing domain protein [Umbelopsis sp. PMI_123]|nr:WD40-repeat-containing domain protein [Umbelopsis sp. PMI_123]